MRFLSFRRGLIGSHILTGAVSRGKPLTQRRDLARNPVRRAMPAALLLFPLRLKMNTIGTEVLPTAADLKNPASIRKDVV